MLRLLVVVVGGGGAVQGQVLEDEIELRLGIIDLALEIADDPVTTADRVSGADVGLENDGSHGFVFVRRGEVADEFGDFFDTE